MEYVPADQSQRDRFINEVEQNFSVVAPAGVGKTTAIVERIAEMAMTDRYRAEPLLPHLVVVTYTRKAAAELRQRAEQKLLQKAGGDGVAQQRLQQAFFGTLHSYALEILKRFGGRLGLPARLSVQTSEAGLEAAWTDFLGSLSLPQEGNWQQLRQLLPQEKLFHLARTHNLDTEKHLVASPSSQVNYDLSPLRAFSAKGRTKDNIALGQRIAQQWQSDFEQGRYAPLPEYEKGGEAFKALWQETFAPLLDWTAEAAHRWSGQLAEAFLQYRLRQGTLSYDDILLSAARLLRQHDDIRRAIRYEAPRFLLDEAQDTDPLQFEILLELARPARAVGNWLTGAEGAPEPGRFCMVGDPQQSIYGDRADLAAYQAIRDKLKQQDAAAELVFSTTWRCQKTIVAVANEMLPSVLNGQGQSTPQVPYVPLQAAGNARKGQALRLPLRKPDGLPDKRSADQLREAYAAELAQWLSGVSIKQLRARDWSQVALLCPRNDWLSAVASALREAGIKVQQHSHKATPRPHPAQAWSLALLEVMANPTSGFELVGILRDIYGIADDALAEHHDVYRTSDVPAFQILTSYKENGEAATVLNQLHSLRERLLGQPLGDAVDTLLRETLTQERLEGIFPVEQAQIRHLLDGVRRAAYEAEDARLNLLQLCERLQESLGSAKAEDEATPGAVQLLSCHKAKGLDWDAVILPFFSCGQSTQNSNYPRIQKTGTQSEVILNKQHSQAERFQRAKEADAERTRQQTERLLYVAMTRARHTLVLLDDAEWFKEKGVSFAQCLQIKAGANSATFAGLSETLTEDATLEEVEEPQPVATTVAEQPLGPERLQKVQALLAQDPLRLTPSQLAVEPDPAEMVERETRVEAECFPGNAIPPNAYGLWWHDTMERAPWLEGDWEAYTEEALRACPDPERGQAEWAQFRAGPLWQWFEAPLQVWTELPYFWPSPDREVYEGLIDWLAFDAAAEQWYLIDWKTDRLPDISVELLRRYGPQIRAYRQALEAHTGQRVQTYLYSTPLGQLIRL